MKKLLLNDMKIKLGERLFNISFFFTILYHLSYYYII